MIDQYLILFYIYALFFVISSISNLLAYKKTKHPVYVYSTILYGGLVLNMFLQIIVSKTPIQIGLYVAEIIIPSWALVKILDCQSGDKTNLKNVMFYGICLFILSLILVPTGNFTLYSFPTCIISILPFFFMKKESIQKLWKKSDFLGKFSLIIVGINALHMLDFPFFRLSPLTQTGFNVYFLLSFIYIFVINRITNQIYLDTVENEIKRLNEEKTELEKSQAVAGIMISLSHEINASLQILKTCSEILRLKKVDEKVNGMITKSVENIKMVNSIFKNSKSHEKTKTTLKEVCLEVESFLDRKNLFQLSADFDLTVSKTNTINILYHLSKMIMTQNSSIQVEKTNDSINLLFLNPIKKEECSNSYLIAQTLAGLSGERIILEDQKISIQKSSTVEI